MDGEMVECRVGVRFLMDVVGVDRAYLKGDKAMIPILTAWTWVATGVVEPLKRPPGLYALPPAPPTFGGGEES